MDEPRPSLSTQLSLPPRPATEIGDTGETGDTGDTGETGGSRATRCLGMDELVAMADGALPPERSDQVLAHVDRCASCADLVGTLGIFDGETGRHPRKLGRYQLERLLGVGGMGMVYVAWDPELQRQVAMKLVRPEHASEKMRARMLGEARALARVSHPHVMSVYDVGEHDGEIFLATELVDGETLGAWQAGRGTAEIVGAWVQVARGLAAAHAEGVVHRDVKPSNALVGRDGRVRIGDFGIAYRLGKEESSGAEAGRDAGAPSAAGAASAPGESEGRLEGELADEIVGTPAYMAPEQRDGVVEARADQFSVCVCLVEALARRRPIADEQIELLPAPLAPLAAALTRGLRRDPAARFSSMTELADALEAALASAQAPPPAKRRWPWLAAALAVLAVLAVGTAVLATAGRTSSTPEPACRAPLLPASLATAEARRTVRVPLRTGAPGDPEPMLGRWIAQWQSAASDVCSAASPPPLRHQRARCLDEQRAQLERLLARLRQAPPADAMSMFAAFDELPRPSRCAARAVLASPPPTEEQAEQLAALELERAGDAGAGEDEGEAEGEAEALRAQLARARRIGYLPYVLQLQRQQAARLAARDRNRGRGALMQAFATAPLTGEGAYELAAMSVDLVTLAASPEEARRQAETARKMLDGLGDPFLEGQLEAALGKILLGAHQTDEALVALENARRSFRQADGPDGLHEAVVLVSIAGAHYQRDNHKAGDEAFAAAGAIFRQAGIEAPIGPPEVESAALIAQLEQLYQLARASGERTEAVFHAEYALAGAYVLDGQPAEALAHYRRTAELGEALGLQGERLAYVYGQIAALLVDAVEQGGPDAAGALEGAVAPARRAVALAEQLDSPRELASALNVSGRLLLARGETKAARAALTRALELRIRNNEPARFRGGTRFLLAQALWREEPARALELAHAARADLQAALDTLPAEERGVAFVRGTLQARLGQLERWLAEHPR